MRGHLKDFRNAETGWRDIYDDAINDLYFVSGEGQWPADIKAEREAAERPILTFNKLWKFIKSVTGDQKQNRPQVKVYPSDSLADIPLAEVFQDIIRHIEYKSKAHIVYDTGFNQCLASGIGFWRIRSEYKEGSFEQDLKIERIRNQLSVLFDPRAKDPLFTDAMYVFISSWMDMDTYKEKYPDKSTASTPGNSFYDADAGWYEEDRIRLSEKYYKKIVKYTIALLNNGETVDLVDGVTEKLIEEQGFSIVQKRETFRTEIYWVLLNGAEILEGPTLWPGKYIPVIPIIGDEMDIQGKLRLYSLIRHAKDAQRMYNYHMTTKTETVALQPRAPWLTTAEQIQGYEPLWREASRTNPPALLYKHVPGQPAPTRVHPPSVPSGSTMEAKDADNDIYDTIGISPPSLGEPSNERSGKALILRQKASDKGTFSFFDNHADAIAHTGKILVDLIPHYYDTTRIIKIMGEDKKLRELAINVPMIDEENGFEEFVHNDMTNAGEYDVILESGPSYETKRQEIAEMLMKAIQFVPQAGPVLIPKLFDHIDAPGAQEVAEQLYQLMDPTSRGAITGDQNTQGMPPGTPGAGIPQAPPPGP
jgi:hypothetical protein